MAKRTLPPEVDVSSSTALNDLFERERVSGAIKKMTKRDDYDDLVIHPLRFLIMIEYGETIAETLSLSVPVGHWHPSGAYTCLVAKRSGGYRELVFPQLLDSLVGRIVIDAMESKILKDDDGKAFCGRSHVNTAREPGDYETWFEVWQDYTAAVSVAAEQAGYAYVYESDVTEFFPSIDRDRAREFLMRLTSAAPEVLELLFFCLEAWLPRFAYSRVKGLPIENYDISRLVAHAYLKNVDSQFVHRTDVTYLRFVDDTVVFVPSEGAAERIREEHHLALKGAGLNPNNAKTKISEVSNYQLARLRDDNVDLDQAARSADASRRLEAFAKRWYSNKSLPNWARVTKRLYTECGRFDVSILREHALEDVKTTVLTTHVLRYLSRFSLNQTELEQLFKLARTSQSVEQRIWVIKFLADAVFDGDFSASIARQGVAMLVRGTTADGRLGCQYLRAFLLLLVNKHGERGHRDEIRQWANLTHLQDEKLRLYYIYMYSCRGEIDDAFLRRLTEMASSDTHLLLRLCTDARSGQLTHHQKLLDKTLSSYGSRIAARYLPFLEAALSADGRREENAAWLRRTNKIDDPVVRAFLDAKLREITR